MALKIGSKAPDFTLPADGGGSIKLSDFQGQSLILYFYPKDDTSGCTKQACSFTENLSSFNKIKARVIGVSRDSVASHDKFKKKYGLKFPLASDEEGKVCAKYGVWVEKSMYGRKYMGIERTTFLIDEQGNIAHIWSKVKVDGHIADVLQVLKDRKKNAA